jgi:hypothetical protein
MRLYCFRLKPGPTERSRTASIALDRIQLARIAEQTVALYESLV